MKRLLMAMLVAGLLVCPAMGEKVKSFCEYGTGVSLQLGAGGRCGTRPGVRKPGNGTSARRRLTWAFSTRM